MAPPVALANFPGELTRLRAEVLKALSVPPEKLAAVSNGDATLTIEAPPVETTEEDRKRAMYKSDAGVPLVARVDVYANHAEGRPINILVDEDGASPDGIVGWKHTFETLHMQYRTSPRLQIVTSLRLFKFFMHNIRHCLLPNVRVTGLDYAALKTVQMPDKFSGCRPHMINCIHIDVSEFAGLAEEEDRRVTMADPVTTFLLARAVMLRTLRALGLPSENMFIDEHVFQRQMPCIDSYAAFIVSSLIPECQRFSFVTSDSSTCMLLWYMAGVSQFNTQVKRVLSEAGVDSDRTGRLLLFDEDTKFRRTSEHMTTMQVFAAVLNHNVRPTLCDFDNAIPCYKSHAKDFSDMFDEAMEDVESFPEHKLEHALFESAKMNVDVADFEYAPGQLEKLCYDGHAAHANSDDIRKHAAFSNVVKNRDTPDRIHVILCVAASLLNCLVVLYNDSNVFEFATHWPTIDALKHFRVIALKRKQMPIKTTQLSTEILVPVRMKDTLQDRAREIVKYIF